jgi:hypothetical protein
MRMKRKDPSFSSAFSPDRRRKVRLSKVIPGRGEGLRMHWNGDGCLRRGEARCPEATFRLSILSATPGANWRWASLVGKNSDEHFARGVVQKTEQRKLRAANFEPAVLAGAEQYYFGFRARVRGASDEWQRVACGRAQPFWQRTLDK